MIKDKDIWRLSEPIYEIYLNPLTAGAVNIRCLHFIVAHYISAFKPVKDGKMALIRKIWICLTSILSNLNNFHSLEVVDRVSGTQLQVSENSNWIIWRLKG